MIPVPESLTKGTDNHRLFMALRSGQPKSHHELYGLHMIVHSRASDLRLKHGCLIDTWRDGRTTWYQLRATVQQPGEVVAAFGGAAPGDPPAVEPSPPDGSVTRNRVSSTSRAGVSISPDAPAQLTVWEAA